MLISPKSLLFTKYTKQQARGGRVVANLINTLLCSEGSLKTVQKLLCSLQVKFQTL